jgi:ABC-2 type transport system permease protein
MWAAGARKYWVIFKISGQKEFEYRFNFFLARLRNVLVMLLLYFVWLALTMKSGRFAGYSQTELITYVFGINILRSVIFGAQSRQVASDINDGMLSAYLAMPINYFFRTFSAEFAQRSLYAVTALGEVLLFSYLFKVDLLIQRDAAVLAFFSVSMVLASTLYFLLSYAISLLAFWSREAMGPKFLFDWVLEFASGAYFPLDILSPALFTVLAFLPFASIMYLPMQIYLGRTGMHSALQGIALQCAWIALFGPAALWVWKRGLKKYTGEGM